MAEIDDILEAKRAVQTKKTVTAAPSVTPTATDTSGFVRNPAQEAAAIASGAATKAEIEARGGVNASGYYGDSYNPLANLSDAEYAAAISGKTGAAQGLSLIHISEPTRPY